MSQQTKNIMDIEQHCISPRPEIRFYSNKKKKLFFRNSHLLEFGVIEPAEHSPAEYIFTIFGKSSNYYKILNLKGLNRHIEKHHFKMDKLWSAE